MRLPTLIALALLLAAALPLPAPALAEPLDAGVAVAPELRQSIRIHGDADFTAENGVRGGSGTPDDPYVISNWTIVADRWYGVQLRDTAAHVRIEDVVMAKLPYGQAGIHLHNASNVTVERVRIPTAQVAIQARHSGHVVLRNIHLGLPSRVETNVMLGVDVRQSHNITIHNLTTQGSPWPVDIGYSADVAVTDSAFLDSWSVVPFNRVTRLTFAGNVLPRVYLLLAQGASHVNIVGNAFEGAEYGIHTSWGGDYHDIHVCGNTFRGHSHVGVDLTGAGGDVLVRGNTIRDSGSGVRIDMDHNVTFERNLVADSEGIGALFHAIPATVRHNAFENNTQGDWPHGVWMSAPHINATHNWWGHPSGPSHHGPGEGDAIVIFHENVTYDPWLTARPAVGPGSVDCAAAS